MRSLAAKIPGYEGLALLKFQLEHFFTTGTGIHFLKLLVISKILNSTDFLPLIRKARKPFESSGFFKAWLGPKFLLY
jgi:hypothetical protein